MVSTRHHPRPFPEPTLAPSRTPAKDTSTSTSSSPTKASPPPSPTAETPAPKRTPARRSVRKSTTETGAGDTTAPTTLTRTRRRTRSQSAAHIYTHHPHSFTITWLLGSLVLVIWDTCYVLGRPHTMPGGRFHSPIWTPYALYGTIDYIYGWPAWNKRNGFTAAQASLNVVETAMYIYYLYVVFSGVAEGWREGVINKLWRERTGGRMVIEGSNVATAVVVCWAAAVMTVSKTLLYGLNEAFSGFDNIGHNDPATVFFLWIVPNGAWLVFPNYIIYTMGKEIVSAMHIAGDSGEKED